jgi:rhodanese-related sulfurtransferase
MRTFERQETLMTRPPTTLVTETEPAAAAAAAAHFAGLLAYETDCWDVHESLAAGDVDFVLVDVRGAAGFAAGHVGAAVNIPHAELDECRLRAYPTGTVFVVYCAGPHCNGADKAARRLALLGRPVKKMIGGVEGWKDEGFELVAGG